MGFASCAPDEGKTPEGDETDSDDEPIGKGVHHNGKAAARRAWLESYMDDNEPDADADDELVGCIALHTVDRGLTWIDYVIVLEKHRGHGLASHAFTHVPGDRIELLVSSENAAGRGLYRKLGFTEATTQYQDWAAEDEIGMTVRTTALPSSSRPAGVGVEVHECTRVGKHRRPVAQAADRRREQGGAQRRIRGAMAAEGRRREE